MFSEWIELKVDMGLTILIFFFALTSKNKTQQLNPTKPLNPDLKIVLNPE